MAKKNKNKQSINPEAILQTAEQALRNKNLSEARRLFQKYASFSNAKNRHIAYYNLAIICFEEKNPSATLANIQNCIKLKPDFYEGLMFAGKIYSEANMHQDAVELYKKATNINKSSSVPWMMIGNSYMMLGQSEQALPFFKQAVELEPNFFNLDKTALAFFLSGDFNTALNYQLQSLQQERTPEGLFNLAEIYRKLFQMENAIKTFREVLKIKPNWVDAHVNFAYTLLHAGEYLEGWKEHDWRRRKRGLSRPFLQPYWNGFDISGKTLLLYGEQGFGDTLQFVRYAPLLKQYNCKVIFECNKPLKTLLSQIEEISEIYAYDEAPNNFDFHCSVMSLPLVMKTTLETIPYQDKPYLKADPKIVEHWKNILSGDKKFKIGLVWHGRPVTKETEPDIQSVSARRNIPLELWKPILDVEGCSFYSLQKGDSAVEQIRLNNLQDKIIDYTDQFNDFNDTAGFIENLDLVIAVDTAIIHLTGAIGKPAWMLSRNDECWRWLTADKVGSRSPWYPTITIYRQSDWIDWSKEINQIKQDLINKVNNQ